MSLTTWIALGALLMMISVAECYQGGVSRGPSVRRALILASAQGKVIALKGGAKSSLVCDDAGVGRGFPEFLLCGASDRALLGLSSDPEMADDGTWTCKQAVFSLLGVRLAPVFVERIEKSEQRVNVVVLKASVVTAADGSSERTRLAGLVDYITSRSFDVDAVNTVSWRRLSSGAWQVSSDLSMQFDFELPRQVLIPSRVFSAAGSLVVRKSCEDSVHQFLEDLSAEYHRWTLAEGRS